MYTVCYVLVDNENLAYYDEMLISLASLRMRQFTGPVVILTDEMTVSALQTRSRFEYQKYGKTELRTVKIPDSYTQPMKSRFLKTTMRDHLAGDFLYLDTDTVVVEPLPDQFDQELALVLDYHNEIANRDVRSRNYIIELSQKCGYTLDIHFPYFNSGCIWAKDTERVHAFFRSWHKEWRRCVEKGVYLDQPSLNNLNRMEGGVIQELPDVYNVQISANPTPINLFSRAKIIHYFNGEFFPKIYLLQFPEVKAQGPQSEIVQNILLYPREAFTRCLLTLDENSQEIEKLRKWAANRQQRVDELVKEREEKNQIIEKLRKWAANRQQRVDELVKEREEKNQIIEKLRKWIDNRQQLIDELRDQLNKAEAGAAKAYKEAEKAGAPEEPAAGKKN